MIVYLYWFLGANLIFNIIMTLIDIFLPHVAYGISMVLLDDPLRFFIFKVLYCVALLTLLVLLLWGGAILFKLAVKWAI